MRKFEDIVPFLKGIDNFGWTSPLCYSDPYYQIRPVLNEGTEWDFRPFTVNIKTGWHTEIRFREDGLVHYIPEGISKTDSKDWSDYCYRANCDGEYHRSA